MDVHSPLPPSGASHSCHDLPALVTTRISNLVSWGKSGVYSCVSGDAGGASGEACVFESRKCKGCMCWDAEKGWCLAQKGQPGLVGAPI